MPKQWEKSYKGRIWLEFFCSREEGRGVLTSCGKARPGERRERAPKADCSPLTSEALTLQEGEGGPGESSGLGKAGGLSPLHRQP